MKKLSFLLLLVASLQTAGCSNTSIETENANQKETKVSKNCGRNMTQRSKCKDT
jgi:ABC-type Fe3+-citrate transport system substrate-binding protein